MSIHKRHFWRKYVKRENPANERVFHRWLYYLGIALDNERRKVAGEAVPAADFEGDHRVLPPGESKNKRIQAHLFNFMTGEKKRLDEEDGRKGEGLEAREAHKRRLYTPWANRYHSLQYYVPRS